MITLIAVNSIKFETSSRYTDSQQFALSNVIYCRILRFSCFFIFEKKRLLWEKARIVDVPVIVSEKCSTIGLRVTLSKRVRSLPESR